MSNENIVTQKIFPLNVSELYNAWTEEEALKQWWKPAGRILKSVTADLSPGGSVRYVFEEDGNSNGGLVIEGIYETVIPNEQLTYTWNWKLDNVPVENGNYKLNIAFSAGDNGSNITVTQESGTAEEGIHPNKEGWDDALNDLEAYLSKVCNERVMTGFNI